MISCDHIRKSSIRTHYDLTTLFYRLFWGVHIHHGLWEDHESPEQAQTRLIEQLAAAADIRTGSTVLDVGCGMGGSAIHLAGKRRCRVVGLTLSPVQRNWARFSAWWHGVGGRTRFVCQDAEKARFADDMFDVVWSIECTEHLFDKGRFFQNVAGWLRPGGRLAICAWLAAEEPQTAAAREQVMQVCEGFLCPSLGTAADYRTWMEDAGLEFRQFGDITEKVTRTWEICSQRTRSAAVRTLARCGGPDMARFVERFETIWNAYRSGAMRYGYFIARKNP
jgi:tocopherol O-methyltransferase